MTKANNHPLVRDLRAILDKHGFRCAVFLAVTPDNKTMSVSVGNDTRTCDALGPVLKKQSVQYVYADIEDALFKL